MLNQTAAIVGTVILGVALVVGLIQLTLGCIGLVEHRIEISRAKRGTSARPHRRRLEEPHHWNKIILGASLLVIGSVLIFLISHQAPVSGTQGSDSAVPAVPAEQAEQVEPAEVDHDPGAPDEFGDMSEPAPAPELPEPGLESGDITG